MRALLVFALLAGAIHARGLKNVLILDFKNVDKQKSYQYLEVSITDQVTKDLKKQFAFRQAPKKKWQRIAEDNNIYADDWHTATAAMYLGQLTKQDVVIAGGYRVDAKKNIVTSVKILDISKKKLISEFTVEGPADSRIFDSVKKIAERIVKEAKGVLPNKSDFEKGSYDITENVERYNLLGFRGGMAGLSVPSAYTGTLQADTILTPADIESAIIFSLEYQRLQALRDFGLWFGADYYLAESQFIAGTAEKDATAKLSYLDVAFGLAYRWYFGRFYVQPMTGLGYALGSIVLTTTSEPERTLSNRSPSGRAVVRGGIELTSYFGFELGVGYHHFFYTDGNAGSVVAQGGVVIKL